MHTRSARTWDVQEVVSPRGDILIVMPLRHFEQLSSAAKLPARAMDGGLGYPAQAQSARIPDLVREAIDRGETPLLAWRKYLAISQIRLAEMSGLSRHTILRIEREGAGAGNRRTRSKLAAALGVAVGSL